MDEDQDVLLSRRRLLATGALVVAGVTLPATNASARKDLFATAAKTVKPPRHTRQGWRRARFAPHVGTPVDLRPRGALAVRGSLVGVEDVPYIKGLAGDQDVYTLRFRAPAAQPLPAGVVGVRHQHFGAIDLYLAPVPPMGSTQDYLAVVNRRVPRSAGRAPLVRSGRRPAAPIRL